ncbi:MAG: FkbM family methyltransferase [Limisphaerales bacterium]
MSSSLRGKLVRALRQNPLGSWLLDEFPCRVTSASGARRWSTRRLATMLKSFGVVGGEPAMVLAHYDGGDVLDIGGHHGGYCFLLAEKAKPGSTFVSFEPAPSCRLHQQHNLATLADMYPGVRFIAVPLPVGNGAAGEFTFPMGESYHPRVVSGAGGKNTLKTIRVDDAVAFFNLKPSFLKVDVEGAEVFVVEGMQGTLGEHRPKVMLEFHPAFQPDLNSPARIVSLLEGAGYQKVAEVDSKVAQQQMWLPAKS